MDPTELRTAVLDVLGNDTGMATLADGAPLHDSLVVKQDARGAHPSHMDVRDDGLVDGAAYERAICENSIRESGLGGRAAGRDSGPADDGTIPHREPPPETINFDSRTGAAPREGGSDGEAIEVERNIIAGDDDGIPRGHGDIAREVVAAGLRDVVGRSGCERLHRPAGLDLVQRLHSRSRCSGRSERPLGQQEAGGRQGEGCENG